MRKVETRGMSVGKLVSAAVIAVVGAGSTYADDKWDIKLEANAPEVCSFSAVDTTPIVFAEGELIGANAKAIALTREVFKLDSAFCNYPADVTLTSTNGALLNDGMSKDALPSSMANIIKYKATLTWGSGNLEVEADGSDVESDSDLLGPTNAPVKISITSVADGKVLLEGDYADTLTLTIGSP